MNDTKQIFKVETETGEIKEAELLTIFHNNDVDYAIYAIDNNDATVQIFASRIVTDENGETTLLDLNDNKEKEDIINMIREKLID